MRNDIEIGPQETEWDEYTRYIGLCENRESFWALVDVEVKFWVSQVWGFCYYLKKYQLFKKDHSPRSQWVAYCSNKQFIHTKPIVLPYYEEQPFNQ